MEREVWNEIVTQVAARAKPVSARFRFGTAQIVLVQLWAALHDRPVSWACVADHWPTDVRPTRLPTPSTLSRRLRTQPVRDLLAAVERRCRGPARFTLVHLVDGKPLPIANHSRDSDAGYGRGAGGKAKGYKIHVITSLNGDLIAWQVRPIHHDEPRVAAELLRQKRFSGYLLADRNYDRNALYQQCRERGIQLLAPRRYGAGRGLGHHRHDPGRLRAIAQIEQSLTGFAPKLLRERRRIERWFGRLSSSSLGLTYLPPWVRTLERVQRWITAKFIVWHCAKRLKKRSG
jgi:hypothetical protein